MTEQAKYREQALELLKAVWEPWCLSCSHTDSPEKRESCPYCTDGIKTEVIDRVVKVFEANETTSELEKAVVEAAYESRHRIGVSKALVLATTALAEHRIEELKES